MQEQYRPEDIEQTIQEHWEKNNTFKVTEDNNKENITACQCYLIPSGRLHMGHP